ncbi:MAG TPA: hypothetical protein VJL29_15760 [Thermoguttaceae bacterium]|nr:hypothetical protein [Thermoguttaceae bacterium]
MNSDRQVIDTLEQLARDWPADASLVDCVMSRLETDAPATLIRPRPLWFRRSLLSGAMAVAIVIVVGMVIVWGGNTNSLYAQVREAIRRANSLHVVANVIQEGKETRYMESWYLREVGFRVDAFGKTCLDNSRNYWQYRKGTQMAYRSASTGMGDTLEEALDLQRLLGRDSRRYPEGDRRIDDTPCKCYRVTGPNWPDGQEMRVLILVAPENRVRRVLMEKNVDDRWKTQIVHRWEFDRPVDQDLFQPKFGHDVQIIDVEKAFDAMADLDKAVYVKEREGIIFAIHAIERLEDGGVFLLTSMRGTEQTLREFPAEPRRLRPDLFIANPPARLSLSDSDHIDLAEALYHRVDVRWWIIPADPRVRPARQSKQTSDKVKFAVGFRPWGRFADRFKDHRGVIHDVMWDVEVDVPVSEKLPTLRQIAERVYGDLRALPPNVYRRLELCPKYERVDFGRKKEEMGWVTRSSDTEDIAAAEYVQSIEDHVRNWQERNGPRNLSEEERRKIEKGIPRSTPSVPSTPASRGPGAGR